jgi:hypothetical protein
MPDEMRRKILRAGGSAVAPAAHPGWLVWFAGWLNEAASRLEGKPGGRTKEKEAAFQIDWHMEAGKRTNGNPVALWDVARRLFTISFPSPKPRYDNASDYKRTVKRRFRAQADTA